MSGTGSCVYTRCDSEEHAQELHAKLPTSMTGYVGKGRNASPLYDFSG